MFIPKMSYDYMGAMNYANGITTSLDDSVSVKADIIGDSKFIPYQVVLGYEILETDGYFQEDSIFFKYII